jgi:hypothetical protein
VIPHKSENPSPRQALARLLERRDPLPGPALSVLTESGSLKFFHLNVRQVILLAIAFKIESAPSSRAQFRQLEKDYRKAAGKV